MTASLKDSIKALIQAEERVNAHMKVFLADISDYLESNYFDENEAMAVAHYLVKRWRPEE